MTRRALARAFVVVAGRLYNGSPMSEIQQHQLENGLWLVAEPIEGMRSASVSLLLPAGAAHEPSGQQGAATLLAEIIRRGAGELDARAHSDALDDLGVQRDANAGGVHIRLAGTMIGAHLHEALPLLLDMARRPLLPAEALEPSRALALQSLDALEDEPQQKAMLELRSRHLPQPFGRPLYGRREDVDKMTLDQLRQHQQSAFVANGAVLGAAGNVDWDELRQLAQQLLGDWNGQREEPNETEPAPGGYLHLPAETAQVHIGVAYEAAAETDPNAMLQRTATAVLSGGMSGRLFTEVREKRGLCYSVGARYSADKARGAVFCYAGSTTGRAQETLDVLIAELRRLGQGVKPDEFDRAVVGMKSRLVMQGESTAARCGAIAMDQYLFGKPRRLEEIEAQIDAIEINELNAFLADQTPDRFTIVTVGPNELRAP